MSQRRKRDFDLTDELPTPVDYLVGGVAPLLIMVMVGSLVWFLQDLIYVGTHSVRLRWVLVWFAIGMVGIARIAMERSPAYAGIYALGLGGGVAVMMQQFFVMPPVGWLLLGVVWWCTHQLVWDCTLVDNTKDASGEGLLEIAGLDETAPDQERAVTLPKSKSRSWWRRLFVHDTAASAKPHPHGIWVIWFSLAALPMFGFGQAALTRMGRDTDGLALIGLYLTAAMGLLLTTSFLGLRRYLRQRRLKMPGAMAAGWLATGAAILAAVVIASLLVPRPLSLAANESGANSLTGKVRKEHITKNDERGEETPGEPGTEPASNGGADQPDPNGGEGGEQSGQQGDGGQEQGGGDSALVQDRQAGQSGSTRSPAGSGSGWARWLGWLIVLAAVAYVLIRYWREILAALRELWASLCGLFEPKETRRRRKQGGATKLKEAVEPRPRFAELPNPFATGSPDPDIAVRETFAALEVWATERGAGRTADATPLEFARDLMAAFPDLAAGIRQLATLYSGLAYAERRVQPAELPAVQRLWDGMAAGS